MKIFRAAWNSRLGWLLWHSMCPDCHWTHVLFPDWWRLRWWRLETWLATHFDDD